MYTNIVTMNLWYCPDSIEFDIHTHEYKFIYIHGNDNKELPRKKGKNQALVKVLPLIIRMHDA